MGSSVGHAAKEARPINCCGLTLYLVCPGAKAPKYQVGGSDPGRLIGRLSLCKFILDSRRLDLYQERELLLASDKDIKEALTRALTRATDLNLDLDRDRAYEMVEAWAFEKSGTESLVRLFDIVNLYLYWESLILSLPTLVRKRVQRGQIIAIKEQLSRFDTIVANYEPAFQAQAREDWEWVLKQSWSPAKLADLLLEYMPDEIDISPETIIYKYQLMLRNWIAENEPKIKK
jgi:hypothetical protein